MPLSSFLTSPSVFASPQSNLETCLRPSDSRPSFNAHPMSGSVGANPSVYRNRRSKVPGSYQCSFCGKMLSSNQALKNHYLLHTGERPHVCKICNMSFTQLYNLKAHEYRHTGTSPYKCKTCNKNFSSAAHLRRHELCHSGERPYSCSICDRRFARIDRLRDHERSRVCQQFL